MLRVLLARDVRLGRGDREAGCKEPVQLRCRLQWVRPAVPERSHNVPAAVDPEGIPSMRLT